MLLCASFQRRDRTSGRIWRVVPKGATLPTAPKIAGAPVAALLDQLKSAQYRIRDLARRELAELGRAAVEPALAAWVRSLDRKDARVRHHQVEAMWLARALGAPNLPLLREIIACEEPLARSAATLQLRHVHALLPDALDLLRARAGDASGLVRMEAAIAASYIGTAGALEAMLGVLQKPAGAHLAYAIRTSLESEALSRHWKNYPSGPEAKAITAFLRGQDQTAKAGTKAGGKAAKKKQDAGDPFDRQPGLVTVTISSVPERMLFDVNLFSVKPGQPVKLVFNNPDAMQHNLVIVKPGALEEVGMAGNEMAKDPDGIKKDFVPESDKVLHATKLIEPLGSVTMRFLAPLEPSSYPYVCTFPGHWPIMNGVMEVKP